MQKKVQKENNESHSLYIETTDVTSRYKRKTEEVEE